MQRFIVASIALIILSFALLATAPTDLVPAAARKDAADFSLEDSQGMLIRLMHESFIKDSDAVD
jgi:hypothetical protein